MLRFLSVNNLATIERIELEFTPGFVALTGETGAGKSIIIDALSLVLGGRADSAAIRTGESQISVEGIFVLNECTRDSMTNFLADSGIDGIDEEVILSREVKQDGRNICRLNDRIVPLKVLTGIGELLVDIHGQGQHISLQRPREHIGILDRYADLDGRQMKLAGLVDELLETRKGLDTLSSTEKDLAHRVDLLKYEIAEIDQSNLSIGEDDRIEQELEVTRNAERLRKATEDAYNALYGSDAGSVSATDMTARAYQQLGQVEHLNPTLKQFKETAESLMYQLEELARGVRHYCDSIDYSPEKLQEMESRIDQINRLKKKYGDSIQEILEYKDRASEELDGLVHNNEAMSELRAKEEALTIEAGQIAEELSMARRKAASGLCQAIEKELDGLAMPNTRVKTDFRHDTSENGLAVRVGGEEKQRLAFDRTGVDKVAFLISANQGEAMRPLVKVASGGETSRLMLAFKAVLSKADQIPVLVFDEIDVGIGGRIGLVIGQMLWELSKEHQVLCVTHLPQIAAFADQHIAVSKAVEDGRTVTRVSPLNAEERVKELSQMLGSTSETSSRSAEEMLARAAEAKSSWIGTIV